MVRVRAVRKNGPAEYIGFLSNNHCHWIAVSKARKACLLLTPRFGERRLNNMDSVRQNLPQNYAKHNSGHLVLKILYCKKQNCFNIHGYGLDEQLIREVQKIKKLLYRNRPEERLISPAVDESCSIRDKQLLNLKKTKILQGKTDSTLEVPVPKPGASEVLIPADKSFPMENHDKYLFILIFLGLVCAGIRNLIEGLSEVPRPSEKGF